MGIGFLRGFTVLDIRSTSKAWKQVGLVGRVDGTGGIQVVTVGSSLLGSGCFAIAL